MATFRSLAEFDAELRKLGRELAVEDKRRITARMAEDCLRIANAAARADLGPDGKFSGWVPTLELKIKPLASGASLLIPTRSSAGPWTVAERGRNQGNAPGFAGPGLNANTGITNRNPSGALRKVRGRKARRWNGVTQPKHTASDAIEAMDRVAARTAEVEVRKVLRRHFDVD